MAPIDPATAVYEVSDQLLAEYGLRRGVVASSAYSCADSDAVLISLARVARTRSPWAGPRSSAQDSVGRINQQAFARRARVSGTKLRDRAGRHASICRSGGGL